jgi:DNA-binding response OmpR family regulator
MYMVLLGEHQDWLSRDLSRRLDGEFLIHTVTHTWQTAESFRQCKYDAILLDSALPLNGGFAACSDLRSLGCAATIFIMGASDVMEHHEQAFASGADGYFCSDFGTRDIPERIKAAIRRRAPHGTTANLVWRDLTLDVGRGILLRGGLEVRLFPKEVALLEYLLRHQDQVLSAKDLWQQVWNGSGAASDTVRTHVNSIRKKLELFDARAMIQTLNGLGYKVIP